MDLDIFTSDNFNFTDSDSYIEGERRGWRGYVHARLIRTFQHTCIRIDMYKIDVIIYHIYISEYKHTSHRKVRSWDM